MYHHFSFLAVSLAMSGLGLGGVLVRLEVGGRRAAAATPWLAMASAGAIVGAALVAFHAPVRLESSPSNWLRVSGVLAAAVVPFTLLGVVIAQAFTAGATEVRRLYFVDLVGAAVACIVLSPITRWLGAPNGLLVAAISAAIAGAFFADRGTMAHRAAIVLTGLLAITVVANQRAGFFDVRMVKGGPAPATDIVKWNPFSRVEVRELARIGTARPPSGWGLSTELRAPAHEAYLLYDASAATQIIGFDGDLRAVDYLTWDVTSAAHHARRHPRTLVLGAGAGRDVLTALAGGSSRVVAVEINDVTVDLMKTRLDAATGGLYTRVPEVEVVVEDGRAFVERPGAPFDLIQLSLVDTWAASAAGAYALTENGLYTEQAFDAYVRRLTPDGFLSFSRWYDDEPFEALRLLALVRRALARDGHDAPRAHVLVVRSDPRVTGRPSMCTVLVKRTPFTAQERDQVVAWAHRMRFLVSFAEGATGAHVVRDPRVADVLDGRPSQSQTALGVDLSAPTDDRPFFFDRVPLVGYVAARIRGHATAPLPLGSQILAIALVTTLLLALALCALPLIATKTSNAEVGSRRSVVVLAALLGLGYVGAEVVLLQRLSFFLGDPSLTLSAVLGVMLATSGLGAMSLRRTDGAALRASLLIAATSILVSGLVLSRLSALAGLSPGLRLGVAVLVAAPVGFVLGRPFPTLLSIAGARTPLLLTWAWAANGAFSVVGSVLAVVVSMTAGFSVALGGIALVYGLAAAMAPRPSSNEAVRARRRPCGCGPRRPRRSRHRRPR